MDRALSEWGLAGIAALRARVAVLVIVDVLSFPTAVDAAVSRGAIVHPFPGRKQAAARRAADRVGAVLAQPRRTRRLRAVDRCKCLLCATERKHAGL